MGNHTRPNILLIITDQQRIDTLGAYGNRTVRTPHVDALAAAGTRFDNSFCPYPVCTPSRYSMVSGLYVHEHRAWSNHSTLPPDIETFPRILRRNGYATKAIGKMHYTPTYADVGFAEMLLAEQNGAGRWDDDYHRELQCLGLIDRNDLEDQEAEFRRVARKEYWESHGALPSNLIEAHHSTTWIGNHAVEALEHWGPSGQLLVASFIKPHHPHDPSHPWSQMYEPDSVPLLPGWTETCPAHDLAMLKGFFSHATMTEAQARRITACYYANVSQIDYHVGRMVEALRHQGLYEDALIIYTSDHGDYLGYHHQMLKGGYMYDPLLKVPLIIKFPHSSLASRAAGSVSTALVSNIDLAPTILRQAGCAPASRMHGLDLSNVEQPREFIFAETLWSQHQLMVRSQHRKLLVNRGSAQKYFYDLQADPFELQDLSGRPECESELRRFERALYAWREDHDQPAVNYVDEDAPCIDRPNVPSRKDNHRVELQAYTRRKMAELAEQFSGSE